MEEATALFTNSVKSMTLAQLKKIELIQMMGLEKKEIKVIGRSCLIFSPSNCIRRFCYNIVK